MGLAVREQLLDVGFEPDFVWIKRRDGADNHVLQDAVRGNDRQLILKQ